MVVYQIFNFLTFLFFYFFAIVLDIPEPFWIALCQVSSKLILVCNPGKTFIR